MIEINKVNYKRNIFSQYVLEVYDEMIADPKSWILIEDICIHRRKSGAKIWLFNIESKNIFQDVGVFVWGGYWVEDLVERKKEEERNKSITPSDKILVTHILNMCEIFTRDSK